MHKHHGIAYGLKNQEEGLEFYTCYTLFDITNTGIIMPYNSNLNAMFLDTAEQPVYNEKTWERSRNQQRNWDTMVQIISMRAQPLILQSARMVEDDVEFYNFGGHYTGVHKIWAFRFGIEAKDAYRKGDNPVYQLTEDSALVPMSTGLTETAAIDPAAIDTKTYSTNTYFEFGYIS